jgi:hypothetical protein
MSEIAEARVFAGVELLNSEVPGWRDRLDVSLLDVGGTHDCVLGQVFNKVWHENINEYISPFLTGAMTLFGDYHEQGDNRDVYHIAQDYGFEKSWEVSYDDLQDAWENVLSVI